MSKVAYGMREAAEQLGVNEYVIVEAIRDGALVARSIPGSAEIRIAHYDLELFLLGWDDYQQTAPARAAAKREQEAREEANRAAKSAERKQAKEARAAERQQLAADLAELERLRELVHN